MNAQVNVPSNTSHGISIAPRKQANATLIVSKRIMGLFLNGCVKRAAKSVAHPQLPACGKTNKCNHLYVALMGASIGLKLVGAESKYDESKESRGASGMQTSCCFVRVTYSLTHSLTHSLPHSLTHSLICQECHYLPAWRFDLLTCLETLAAHAVATIHSFVPLHMAVVALTADCALVDDSHHCCLVCDMQKRGTDALASSIRLCISRGLFASAVELFV